MYKRYKQDWLKHVDFFIVDEIALQIAYICASLIRHGTVPYTRSIYVNLSLWLVLIDFASLILFDAMHNVMKRGYIEEITSVIRHASIVFGLTAVYVFVTKLGDDYSRMLIVIGYGLYMIITYIMRLIWKAVLRNVFFVGSKKRVMVVVLHSTSARKTLERLLNSNVGRFFIAGVIIDKKTDIKEIEGVPVVASLEDASGYIAKRWVDDVFIDGSIDDRKTAKLVEDCITMAVPVHYLVPAIGEGLNKQFVEKIAGMTVLTSSINSATPMQNFVKRSFDIIGALIGSVITLIIMVIVGPMIKKESPGPILYRQERIGLNGKKFKIFKLRSMYMDADERKKELMDKNRVKDGMMFKLDFDPRIIGNKELPDGTRKTGIGEFIRKTSLDEFPQFFNVLAGQMSLVGTRPPTVDEWEKYEFHHRARLACKPGITGLWQVSGRSEITDFEQVVKLDTEYITNWSFALDVKILFKTVVVVLGGEGAM
ncbi:MAG: sugar transferase [Lachnospiraceae bacterium]|nr:sugar transferase [Lachnospiraceae bacterium]